MKQSDSIFWILKPVRSRFDLDSLFLFTFFLILYILSTNPLGYYLPILKYLQVQKTIVYLTTPYLTRGTFTGP